jgi:nucleoid-associated protein YgaU
MTINRYQTDEVFGANKYYGTAQATNTIRAAINSGTLALTTITLAGAQRLDTLAGDIYGDATLWWVLAAASNIGWGLQVPPGTVISVPRIEDVLELL